MIRRPPRSTRKESSAASDVYKRQEFYDQQELLDKMMQASQLAPIYNNEMYLKGVLYVINIDDKKSAVKYDDLLSFGIR